MVERIKKMTFEKVGEKVMVRHETQKEVLFHGPETNKSIVGEVLNDYTYSFETKEKAIEFFNASLTNCCKGIQQFTEEIKSLEEKVMDIKIFDRIEQLKGKLDNSKLKGKYPQLEAYMGSFTRYNTLKNQLKIMERDVPYLNEILKIVKEL